MSCEAKKEKYYVQSEEEMKTQLLEKGLGDSTLIREDGAKVEGDRMQSLCRTLSSLEEAILTLERRGISLKVHAERMDPESKRLPVFHLDLGPEDHWFVTRDKLDEFLVRRKIRVESTTTETSTVVNSEPSSEEASPKAAHISEIYEVRTINTGLQELADHGFSISDLIPKDRTGSTDSRFYLQREENLIGIEDLRELLPAIRESGRRGLTITRFKGLGEMNAEELRETTLDPQNRTMVKIELTDAAAADEMFRVLMGDKVEPRREFIEKHALDVRNLDV